jgi:hypothetical protein
MDQDDPEKRIADLERQQTSAIGEPRRHDPARSPKSGSPGRVRAILMGLVFAGVPTVIFVSVAYNDYAYHLGTPTTAKNVVCVFHPGSWVDRYRDSYTSCTAAWSLDGRSYTGEIVGASDGDKSVDVRVRGGTAYTANAFHNNVPLELAALGGIIGMFAFGFRYESRRAARAPLSCEQCGAQLNQRDGLAKNI